MAVRPPQTHLPSYYDEVPDESVKGLVQRLIADAKLFAQAEIDLYKTKASITGRELGIAAGLGFGAWTLANAALIALLVGLILTLDRTGLGPGAATAIVVLVTLAIAGVLGMIAYGQVKKALGTAPAAKETAR